MTGLPRGVRTWNAMRTLVNEGGLREAKTCWRDGLASLMFRVGAEGLTRVGMLTCWMEAWRAGGRESEVLIVGLGECL